MNAMESLLLIAVVLHTFGVGLNVAVEGFKEYISSFVVIVISIVVLIVYEVQNG